jgi:hypothetical protein
MNKFTLVVEGDQNKPTPEQELETAWTKFNADKKVDTLSRQNTYEFYHEMRSNGFDSEIIFTFFDKIGIK